MNVMVYNKYKELLMGLNIEVMKSMEGVYNVDEIIDTFTNFYYDKMDIYSCTCWLQVPVIYPSIFVPSSQYDFCIIVLL